MQRCYGTVRFIIYNTDWLLFNCAVNIQIFCDNKDAVYTWVNQSVNFCKQEAQLLPIDHAMHNVNPNLNPNRNPNCNDANFSERNANVNQLMHPHWK